jgi:protein-S-isoprenylcysteine O-methyltransferase Ste14
MEFCGQGRSGHGPRHHLALSPGAPSYLFRLRTARDGSSARLRQLASWPALTIVLFGIVPTFTWRARAEEKLLSGISGECYAVYQKRTKMIIPYVL